MTGYIVLIIFLVSAVSIFIAFFFGISKGKKLMKIKQTETELQKAKDILGYEQKKEEFKQEVFTGAAIRKIELDADGVDTTGRDRFNRINDILRGKPANKN